MSIPREAYGACINCGRLGAIPLRQLPYAVVCSLRCERLLVAQLQPPQPKVIIDMSEPKPTPILPLRAELATRSETADRRAIADLANDNSPLMQKVFGDLRTAADRGEPCWFLNGLIHPSRMVQRAIAERLAALGLTVTETQIGSWSVTWVEGQP